MDGEYGPAPATAVDHHLQSCADCRAWEMGALALEHRLRLEARPRPEDRTASIVAAVHASTLPRHRPVRTRAVRVTLAVVAMVQLVFCVPVLVLGRDHAAPEHVAHELGAFSVAIALGFALAALRPRLATGMVPIAGILASLLLVTAGTDIATGATDIGDELPHLLELAGFLLLLRLAHLGTSGRRWPPLLLPIRHLRGERAQPC